MNLNRTIFSVILGLAAIGPGFAQTPTAPPSGSQKSGVTQPRGGDVANRSGGTKQRQPRPSTVGDPQSTEPSDAPSPEDERMNRALNGICRGC
jgi:hypothetical protein